MQRYLNYLRTKIKTWKDQRFLKRHCCDTWSQYNHRYDPDVVWRAVEIRNFYQGYPYVYCFENHNHDIYSWDLGYDGSFVVRRWCDENCKGKFRFDMHRAINYPSTGNQWTINEIGGLDYIFFACQDEQDFLMFNLRW